MDPLIGNALISGAGSLLGSLFGGVSENKATKQTNATNLEIANRNNKTSIDIANANNALQERMNIYNNEFARQSAIDMFNMENAYNTPEAQKQRLLEAGLNPASMYANGAQVAQASGTSPAASGSGISPSMPTLSTPTMQTPPSVLGAMFGNLESVTRALSNLSQSNLNQAEESKVRSLLSSEVKKAIADANNAELDNAVKQFQFNLDKVFSYAERDKSLLKVVREAEKIYQDGILAAIKQDTERSQKLMNEAETKLKETNNKLLNEQLPYLVENSKQIVNLTKEQVKTEKATQNMYGASAEASLSSARFTDEQRSQLSAMYKNNIRISNMSVEEKKLNLELLKRSLDSQVEYLENLGLLSWEQYRKFLAEADAAHAKNSTYWFDYVFGKITSILQMSGDAVSDMKGTPFLPFMIAK